MNTEETKQRGTSLEEAAPYLAYDPEFEYNGDGKRYNILRLSLQGGWVDIIEVGAEGDSFEVELHELTICLRPFSALVTPLPSGEVPAKEVLLLIDSLRYKHLFTSYIKRLFVQDESLMMEVDGAAFEKEIYTKQACLRSHLWGGDMKASVADYLRRNHFACDLNGRPLLEGTDFIAK